MLGTDVNTKLSEMKTMPTHEEIIEFYLAQYPEDLQPRLREVITASQVRISEMSLPSTVSFKIGPEAPGIKLGKKLDLTQMQPEIIELFHELFPDIEVAIMKPHDFMQEAMPAVSRLRKSYFVDEQHWAYDTFNGLDTGPNDLQGFHIVIKNGDNVVGAVRVPLATIPYVGQINGFIDMIRHTMYMASTTGLSVSPYDQTSIFAEMDKATKSNEELRLKIEESITRSLFPTVERLCVMPYLDFVEYVKANGYLEKYRTKYNDPDGDGELYLKFLYMYYAAKINSLLMATMCGLCISLGAPMIFFQTTTRLRKVLENNFGSDSIIPLSTIQQRTISPDGEASEDTCETMILNLDAAIEHVRAPIELSRTISFYRRQIEVFNRKQEKNLPSVQELIDLETMRTAVKQYDAVSEDEREARQRDLDHKLDLYAYFFNLRYFLRIAQAPGIDYHGTDVLLNPEP